MVLDNSTYVKNIINILKKEMPTQQQKVHLALQSQIELSLRWFAALFLKGFWITHIIFLFLSIECRGMKDQMEKLGSKSG